MRPGWRGMKRDVGLCIETFDRHVRRAPGVQERLEHHLGGDRVAPLLALLVRQPRVPESRLGEYGREPLVREHDGQRRHPPQPIAELLGLAGLDAFASGRVQRQSDDDPTDVLPLDESSEVLGVAGVPLPLPDLQRRRDDPIRVRNGHAEAHRAVVHPEQPRTWPGLTHGYFSSPGVLFSRSTTSFTVPSSRRSAIRVASPSWMMTRLLTPMVTISRPASPAITHPEVLIPRCNAWTVLPFASCGLRRSSASQLPTSSHWYGASITRTRPAFSMTAKSMLIFSAFAYSSRNTSCHRGVSHASAIRWTTS